MRHASRSLILLLLLALSACSRNASPESGLQGRSSPNRLTQAELLARESRDAYEAVRQLRPNWLRTRGQTSLQAPQPVVIYIDGVRMGGPENLQRISTDAVMSMEYVSAIEASQRFGLDHTNGAILVETQ